MFIDSDTHVDECDDTWAYMPADLVPKTMSLEADQIPTWMHNPDTPSNHSRFWFMDGQLRSRKVRSDQATGTTVEKRELYDVPARVADMDRMRVDVQVIYPTVLLNELTRRVDLDVALCKSYNRWLADRCASTGGRLRWVAMPPLSSIPDAVEELAYTKEHGAIGVFKRGVEWERPVHDPYFFPVYEAAEKLELPICIHASLPWYALDSHFSRLDNPYPQGTNGITVMQAFQGLVSKKIPQQFPALKFGFIEAGSSWLPALCEMTRVGKSPATLADKRFYVTCEANEDLPYLMGIFGDENLIVGTDYCHSDRSAVMNKHQDLLDRHDIDEKSSRKITGDNARAFYGL